MRTGKFFFKHDKNNVDIDVFYDGNVVGFICLSHSRDPNGGIKHMNIYQINNLIFDGFSWSVDLRFKDIRQNVYEFFINRYYESLTVKI